MPERSPLQLDPRDLLWTPDYDPWSVGESGFGEFLDGIDADTPPHYQVQFVQDEPVRRELYAVLDSERAVDQTADTVLPDNRFVIIEPLAILYILKPSLVFEHNKLS